MAMIKVEGEIDYQIWIECPQCKDRFDLTDTEAWTTHLFEIADDLLEPHLQEDNDCDSGVEIQCPECKCYMMLQNTHY